MWWLTIETTVVDTPAAKIIYRFPKCDAKGDANHRRNSSGFTDNEGKFENADKSAIL